MPSAKGPAPKRILTATALLLAAGPLAGCTTTQHAAQRVQLDSARERAAQLATKVATANPVVTARVAATVTGAHRTALVVAVHNAGAKAASDLPISVGYSLPGGPRVYLNAAPGLPYFEAHLPAIFAGRSRVWVYTAGRALPRGARPFALVGRRATVRALLTETDVHVALRVASARPGELRIGLDNSTSVPQYQLQVYAYAERGGRFVAAGNATVTDLGAGSRQTLALPLVGASQGASLHVEAIPTILQ